jgi:hypothetical protein
MNLKTALAVLILTIGLAIAGGSTLPAFANHPDHPSSNDGLDNADERVHGEDNERFGTRGDIEFHTGTGQAGFCVSGFCPER